MKLGDFKSSTLDDGQIKTLATDWLADEDPTRVPWGKGFLPTLNVTRDYFDPWLIARKKLPDSDNNPLSLTVRSYRFASALDSFPLLVERNQTGEVSFNASPKYIEKWITEGDNVPWNSGLFDGAEVATAFMEWFGRVSPKEAAFIKRAYATTEQMDRYIGLGVVKSQHVMVGRKRRRSYAVRRQSASDGRTSYEFFSSHDADGSGRTLVQHWLHSRRDEDMTWADEVGGQQIKTLFDGFCTRFFLEEFGSHYQTHYILRESIEDYLGEYVGKPNPSDSFKMARYRIDSGEQKYRFYNTRRHEWRDKYNLAEPHPLGMRVLRAIMQSLEEGKTDLWTLFDRVEERLGVPLSFHEVQYARLMLLDGGFIGHEDVREGFPLWAVKKPYPPAATISEAKPAPIPAKVERPIITPVKAVIPETVRPSLVERPAPVAPPAPKPAAVPDEKSLTISDLTRLFKVSRHHTARIIEKYNLRQHTKTRYYVPVDLIQRMEALEGRTPLTVHPIGAKFDAARRMIAGDVAKAFNKLGRVPTYDDYVSWDGRMLEFSEASFSHYFSDWGAALVTAGVLKAPPKAPIKPATEPARIDVNAIMGRMEELAALGREPKPVPPSSPDTRSLIWEVSRQVMQGLDEPEPAPVAPPVPEPVVLAPEPVVVLAPEPVVVPPAPPVPIAPTTAPVVQVALTPVPEPVTALTVVRKTQASTQIVSEQYEGFDFMREALEWEPIDPVTKKLNYEHMRTLTASLWDANTIFRVSDIAGCNLMALGQILGLVISLPQHQFLFETRDVGFFNKLNSEISWEPHMYVGVKTSLLTDDPAFIQQQIDLLGESEARIRFLNSDVSPMMLERFDLTHVDWVIAGVPVEHYSLGEDTFLNIRKTCNATGKAFYFKGWYGPVTLDQETVRGVPVLIEDQIKIQGAELYRSEHDTFTGANAWVAAREIKKSKDFLFEKDAYADYQSYVWRRFAKGDDKSKYFEKAFSRHEWDVFVRFAKTQDYE